MAAVPILATLPALVGDGNGQPVAGRLVAFIHAPENGEAMSV